MQTYQQFIAAESLSMAARQVRHNPNMPDSENLTNWACDITVKNGDVWTVPFSMGSGHNGKAPDLADVLNCLASDAAGYENAQDFEEWASEYGYDADSRKAETIYNNVNDLIGEMQAFLGKETYEELLYNTEEA
ncbi:MAG: hypothetical protein OEQ39_04500 [Gammaproteobacteria bacterium]|nr:hypothetical protein [Gammaproteobacteria bacterium]